MGDGKEVARVRRETLSACMTCPLCKGLLREATAINECLHTFCRECIMKEINDEDVDRCPVCDIDLGCDPEEKLRPDHTLQDMRNKLFPIKSEKVPGPTAIPPAKRKERSLASLVVDTPRVEMKAGLAGKRKKAARRTAPHATSPAKSGTTEKHRAPQSTNVVTTASKKLQNADVDAPKKPSTEDIKNGKTTDMKELRKPLNSSVDAASRMKSPRSSPKIRAAKELVTKNKEGKLPIRKGDTENEVQNADVDAPKEPSMEAIKNGKTTDMEEFQKPLNSSIDAASRMKSPRSSPKIRAAKEQVTKNKEGKLPIRKGDTGNEVQNADVDAPKKPSTEDIKNGKTTDMVELRKPLNSTVDAASRMKSPRSSPKIRAAKEPVTKNKEGKLPIRKGDTENEVVSSGTRVRTYSKSRLEENKGNSSEPASLNGKTRTKDNLKQQSLGAASTNALHGAITTPVWFSLVASPNQNEDPQLPQLSNNYLRIKDGCVQISSVQKYIMTKLNLANPDEVEITCQGMPICPSSMLHSLIDLWVRRDPGKPIQASLDAPAKEFVMVLGYRRRRRQPAPAP